MIEERIDLAHTFLGEVLPHGPTQCRTSSALDLRRSQRLAQQQAGEELARAALARFENAHAYTFVRDKAQWRIVAADGADPLWLSISHSGPWVLCALSNLGPLGIDIEHQHRAFEVSDDLFDYLHPSLRARLLAVPVTQQRDAFLQLWPMLEAHGKMVGTDLLPSLGANIFRQQRWVPEVPYHASHMFFGKELGDAYQAVVVCDARHEESLRRLGWLSKTE